MSQDEFTKLFQYLQKQTVELADFREEVNLKFDRLLNTLDGHTKQLTDLEQEMEVMNHQMNRFDKWFNILADNAKIKLKY